MILLPDQYERHLPHFEPKLHPCFVTFRLKGSLSRDQIERLIVRKRETEARIASGLSRSEIQDEQKRQFALYDSFLDSASQGPLYLKDPQVQKIMCDTMTELEQDNLITLWAHSIMANHVHLLFSPTSEDVLLRSVMQRIKGRSAYSINRQLGRRGSLWQDESWDHVVRAGEFLRILRYILLNPVKAGIVENWSDHPGTYLNSKVELG